MTAKCPLCSNSTMTLGYLGALSGSEHVQRGPDVCRLHGSTIMERNTHTDRVSTMRRGPIHPLKGLTTIAGKVPIQCPDRDLSMLIFNVPTHSMYVSRAGLERFECNTSLTSFSEQTTQSIDALRLIILKYTHTCQDQTALLSHYNHVDRTLVP